MRKLLVLFISFFLFVPVVKAATLADELSGKILLQVEENGEAWYVNPVNKQRFFLGRPDDAFEIMRKFGVGITNNDLEKIPINFEYNKGQDSDGDGLIDTLEDAIGADKNLADSDGDGFSDGEELKAGYNPLGEGDIKTDTSFSANQMGKIFLQVESNGEAWYVNPEDRKRYFLGRPADAFNIMRGLGLGISNANIEKISAGTASYNASDLEWRMFEAVNAERIAEGKKALVWNDELANVARKHSRNLASENEAFTDEGMTCEFPIIHHEGLVFGAYNSDRLKNEGIYYYSMSGENIALVPSVSTIISLEEGSEAQKLFDTCPSRQEKIETSFKDSLDAEEDVDTKIEIVRAEINKRTEIYKQEQTLKIEDQTWLPEAEIVKETVDSWMNSPGHRANILENEFEESGIGIVSVSGYIISTQVFIKRANCAYFGGPCCVMEGYDPACFTDLTCENMICS